MTAATAMAVPGSRQSWLDGLRGIAAVVVAWFHFTVDVMQMPYRSFYDDPPEENRYLIQRPPFKLLFCGQAMVRVFFVISGYSVSYSIIRYRDPQNNLTYYKKLSSSVLRRLFRLYIPVAALCVVSQLVFYVGAYHWNFEGNEGCPGAEPYGPFWPHLRCAGTSFLTSMFITHGQFFSGGLNGQLWSMADELVGSIAVYLALICFAQVQPRPRMVGLGFLTALLLWNGSPHTAAFLAGHLYAEIDLFSQQKQYHMPHASLLEEKLPSSREHHKILLQTLRIGILLFGIYFLCLPVVPDFPTDYWFPLSYNPFPLYDYGFGGINGFHAVGSIIVVGVLRYLPYLKGLLASRTAEWLGKISFCFYLFHQVFIRTMRNPIQDFVCFSMRGEDLRATRDDPEGGYTYFLSWVVAGSILGPLVFSASHFLTNVIDRYAIHTSHTVEKYLTGQ